MKYPVRAILSAGRRIQPGDVVKGKVIGKSRLGTIVDLAAGRERAKLVIEPDPSCAVGAPDGRYGNTCLVREQCEA